MTTTPITPAGSDPFKFPSEPEDQRMCYNPVTGAYYRYLKDRNSWVNAGSDLGYDDSPIKNRINDLEQWLKNQIETFVQLKTEGLYLLRPYSKDDPFDTRRAHGTFAKKEGRPGHQRNEGVSSWADFKSWDQCTHIDIHKIDQNDQAINWAEFEKGNGYTFYITPYKGQQDPTKPLPPVLDTYAQLRITDDPEATGSEDDQKFRFPVRAITASGTIEDDGMYVVRMIKTVDEYPAVIVRRGPVDTREYGEGTLWFDLACYQLHVLVENKETGEKDFVAANAPPNINKDLLYNKKTGGGGTFQEVNWGLHMKDATRFSNSIQFYLNDHSHSYLDFFPAEKEYPGISGKYYPVSHYLKPGSSFRLGSASNNTAMIYATHGNGKQQLKLSYLTPATQSDDAARLGDTASYFTYKATVTGDCIVPPGQFICKADSDIKKVRYLFISRLDMNGNVYFPPMTSNCRNQEITNIREYVAIIDPEKKSDGTDEHGKVIFAAYAHTCKLNDPTAFSENTHSMTVDGVRGTYQGGGMNYYIETQSGWRFFFDGYNSLVPGRKYIIKTPALK